MITTWTKEEPKADGFYWWRQDENDPGEVGLVSTASHTCVFPGDSVYYSFRTLGGEWIGPLVAGSEAAVRKEERLRAAGIARDYRDQCGCDYRGCFVCSDAPSTQDGIADLILKETTEE